MVFDYLRRIRSEWMRSDKMPMLFGMFIVYLATIIYKTRLGINIEEFSGLTIVLILQAILFTFHKKIFKNHMWIYFLIHGIIISNYALIMNDGFEPILFGMYPMLIAQSISVYRDAKAVFLISGFYYSQFTVTTIFYGNKDKLLEYLPMFTIVIFAILVFYKLFMNQVNLRIKYQHLSRQLELSNRKVEELISISERQKIARELHDTLSQGVAGLIMQLDAIDANLEGDNIIRAREITTRAARHARLTLAESREVLTNLRKRKEEIVDLEHRIMQEIYQAEYLLRFKIIKNIRIQRKIRTEDSTQLIYILREALNNIIKHAQAKTVKVTVIEREGYVYLEVEDNGVGFSSHKIQKFDGHFGLIGMEERAKALNGQWAVKSAKKSGTLIKLQFPIHEEVDYG